MKKTKAINDIFYHVLAWHLDEGDYQPTKEKVIEKPNPDGPLGWVMTLNNEGQLTVHVGSELSYKIQQAFGVKHENNVFERVKEKNE